MSDYTANVANSLVVAGAEVHVWTSGVEQGPAPGRRGETVHRIAGRFGPGGLDRIDRALGRGAGPRKILIQYVPHAFGWKAMNLALAAWIARRAALGDDVRVMFHEVAFPWTRRPLRHNILAVVHRAMAAVIVRSCTRAYVSTPGWEPLLRRLGAGGLPITWTPVPSNVPGEADADAVGRRRAELTAGCPSAPVIGHFGTYGPGVARDLGPALRQLLGRRRDVRVLLLGMGGDRWRLELAGGRPDWLGRVVAPGPLPLPAIAEHLRACDLVLQPYPDGASGRRSALMAALANGVPAIVTIGDMSEPVWSGGAVATAPIGSPEGLARSAADLMDRPDRLAELGRAGQRLYEELFAIRHTVDALMGPP